MIGCNAETFGFENVSSRASVGGGGEGPFITKRSLQGHVIFRGKGGWYCEYGTEEESNFGRELQRKFVGKKKKPHIHTYIRNKKNPKHTLNNSRTGKILKCFLDFLKEF